MNPLSHPDEGGSLEQFREQLERFLEIDTPLPKTVAAAAMVNPDYGRRLTAARGAPALLKHLINTPPAIGAAASRFAMRPPPAATHGNSAQLLLHASKSLLRWAVTAFTPVDESTYQRRIDACLHCEHLQAPAENLVYRAAKSLDPTIRVCGLCGCVAASKARIPHESCPAIDAGNPALTRWGEPRTATPTQSSAA